MKDFLEIVVSGITELLFWKKTDEYIQSDKKSNRKLFVPTLCFYCAVAIILGLIIVGIYEMIKMDIILGRAYWYRQVAVYFIYGIRLMR